MKNSVLIASLLIVFVLGCIVVKSSHTLNKDTCKKISGIVTEVYEDGTKDAVFKLQGQKFAFYINRGLEKTFNLGNLLERLKGKEVNILYADSWNPLGSISENRAISELSVNEELVYSEFQSK